MTALQILILAASTIAGALGQAKNSGETPKSWVPFVTMGGSFAVAFGASLSQAPPPLTLAIFLAACGAGVQAIGAALFGVVAHIHGTSHQRDDDGAGSGQTVSKTADTIPPAPPRPPVSTRAILVGVLSAAVVLIALKATTKAPVVESAEYVSGPVAGCSWWANGGSTKVEGQGGKAGACVLAQIESGNRDPVSIAAACTMGVLADAWIDFESLFAYYVLGDGGGPVTAGAMVCGADGATPPYQGAPRCISADALAGLREAHARAKLTLAAQGAR